MRARPSDLLAAAIDSSPGIFLRAQTEFQRECRNLVCSGLSGVRPVFGPRIGTTEGRAQRLRAGGPIFHLLTSMDPQSWVTFEREKSNPSEAQHKFISFSTSMRCYNRGLLLYFGSRCDFCFVWSIEILWFVRWIIMFELYLDYY